MICQIARMEMSLPLHCIRKRRTRLGCECIRELSGLLAPLARSTNNIYKCHRGTCYDVATDGELWHHRQLAVRDVVSRSSRHRMITYVTPHTAAVHASGHLHQLILRFLDAEERSAHAFPGVSIGSEPVRAQIESLASFGLMRLLN